MMPCVFLYDFVILHGFSRRVDADHSESGEIFDFARWLEDIYALKNPSHGHKMRLENLGTMGVPFGSIWAVVLFAFNPTKRKQIHVIPIRVIHFSLGKKPRSPEEYGQVGGFSLKADLQKVFAQRPTRHLLPPLWRSGRFVWGHPAVFVPTPCAWTRNAHCDALSFSSG